MRCLCCQSRPSDWVLSPPNTTVFSSAVNQEQTHTNPSSNCIEPLLWCQHYANLTQPSSSTCNEPAVRSTLKTGPSHGQRKLTWHLERKHTSAHQTGFRLSILCRPMPFSMNSIQKTIFSLIFLKWQSL